LSQDGTTIDGDVNDDGVPDVTLVYESGTVNVGAVRIQSSDNHIEGLVVRSFETNGIFLEGNGHTVNNNQIVNCYIGTDGTQALGNGGAGIYAYFVSGPGSSAHNNVLQNNLIAGNTQSGIVVFGASGTQILSNTVGTDLAGMAALPNSTGVYVTNAQTTTLRNNLLSGNSASGLYLNGVTNTLVTNNVIGTNRAGTAALPNTGGGGINAQSGVTLIVQDNLISGNSNYGIFFNDVHDATVVGNYIGTDATGASGLGNGRTGSEEDGVTLVDSTDVVIGGPSPSDRNLISHNGRSGVWIDHSDNVTVQNNFIGTGASGAADLGNGDSADGIADGSAGIYIKDGANDNLIQDNLIRYNYIGVRISGGDVGSGWLPPMNNDVLTNTITSNDKYGISSQVTHSNTVPYTTPAGGDNLFQGNVITGTGYCADNWCTGVGVYNYGASPDVLNNTIESNANVGLVNLVFFGTDGGANYADDILSMPRIAGNSIRSNAAGGITSRDTTPVNQATLLTDNTFFNNGGELHISQRWFGAVEVVSDTLTINSGMAVTITRAGGEPPPTCRNGDCFGDTFDPAGGGDGIWGPVGVDYDNVEKNDGSTTSTWFEIVEYEVEWNGNWITSTPHLVQAGGAYLGARSFSFDGVTTTQEIAGDAHLPTCRPTGILTDPAHTLCRYQIAQIDVLTSGGDYDGDGIPDDEEGNGDTDGDGIPDWQDEDSDGDGIPDDDEYDWCVTEGGTAPCDTDGDGVPDWQDDDDDGDGIPSADEYDWCVAEGGTAPCDTDGDGTPDYLDDDDDGDGIPTDEEYDWCNPPGPVPCDADGDGIPDYLDDDDDGDGVPSDLECPGGPPCQDTDGDGLPDYLDDDDDGDGIPSQDECPAGPPCPDSDGDGTPDYLDEDDDDDGIPTADECPEGSPCHDTDGDSVPDYLDDDDDGDGVPTADECLAGLPCQDSDGDATPDYLDDDDDADGIPTADEYNDPADPDDDFCTNTEQDSDGDGIPDCQDNDADGDGIPNYLDPDSDGDGMSDTVECPTGPPCPDSDEDGIPDWLDPHYYIYLPLVLRNH